MTPTWQRELDNFIGIKPIFVIEGNVADLYPWSPAPNTAAPAPEAADPSAAADFLPLDALLAALFAGTDPGRPRPYRLDRKSVV